MSQARVRLPRSAASTPLLDEHTLMVATEPIVTQTGGLGCGGGLVELRGPHAWQPSRVPPKGVHESMRLLTIVAIAIAAVAGCRTASHPNSALSSGGEFMLNTLGLSGDECGGAVGMMAELGR